MTIVLTDRQMKDTFIELVATAAYKNVPDVTYWSILDYMKRNCETLIDDSRATAKKGCSRDTYLRMLRNEWCGCATL